MKIWIPMTIIFLAILSLCVWDGVLTYQIFDHLQTKSYTIYYSILENDISDENIKKEIHKLNDYWTKKMDTLCISISRKDLQPISDYLQYLYAATINNNQEDAVTYSRLLHYNVEGLQESTGINFINFL